MVQHQISYYTYDVYTYQMLIICRLLSPQIVELKRS